MRSGKTKPFNILPILVLIIFIAVIAGVLYFLFERPSSVACGILLERKENADSIDMKLGYGNETKWIKVNKRLHVPDGIAYNVDLKGIVVTHIEACKVYTGKVNMRSSKSILLNSKSLYMGELINYYKLKNSTLTQLNSNSVIIGSTKDKFIENNGRIVSVIVAPPDVKDIRVGISNSDFTSYDHSTLTMHTQRGFMLNYDGNLSIKLRSEYIRINYIDGGQLELLALNKVGNDIKVDKSILKTSGKLTIEPLRDKPIYIDTLKRIGYSYTPKYYGKLEFNLYPKAFHLINELDIEEYLRFVVPSEMLPSGGIEGYKVQAVAARTYVLSELLSGRFAKYGFHVDDTIHCQAYNSQPANDFCDEAINATKGEVLTYNNKIIDAKYYSTSCGVGAPYNEIWYTGTLPGKSNLEPYLSFKNYSASNIKDLSNNFDAANFLKDWTISSYDSNSPYFRWKYTLDIKTLNDIVNHRIYSLYKTNPQNFKKKSLFSFYKLTKIPKSGIGPITDIVVTKRGIGGNILELKISSKAGTYKITKEYNIKRLFVDDTVQITPLYGNFIKNPSPLPSTYYVIDKELSNNELKTVTIYGGGFGHGAGMSQYGVIGLIRQSKTYKDILNLFYKNVVFDDYINALSKYFE